jgi:hypothetical protein
MASALDALEQRRQEAIQRYLDGDPIEQICREMRCSKSWLYKLMFKGVRPNWNEF